MIDRESEGSAALALENLRVLVVEDEPLVAMLIEDVLAEFGCSVAATASRMDDALAKASSLDFDLAILDVNLNGTKTFPVAESLAGRRIPFVFSTGYGEGGLPDEWRGNPTIQKPFTENAVRDALMKAMGVAQA